jgi:hypothetical protein
MSSVEQKPVPTAIVSHVAALLGCPIMQMVAYYANGDRDGHPMPAVVRWNHSGGVLDLTVFPQGQPLVKNDIKHVDDPIFQVNPRLLREYGAWGYPPGYLPQKFPDMPLEVPAIASAVIREWCNGVEDLQTIAMRCGGISLELVKQVMGEFGRVHKK